MPKEQFSAKEIFKGLLFSKEEIELLESVFHKVSFKKGTILLKAGDLVDTQYYILDGCLRSYFTDKNGKEHTVQFGIYDWWISDFTAFFSSSKAIMTIEVIKNATLVGISKSNRDLLYNKIPKIESFFSGKLEKAFAAFQKRILISLSESYKEQYLNFIQSYPNIEKNVKNYHIASYLGITTESLSRIRKELSQN